MAVVVGDAAVRLRPDGTDFEKDAEGSIVGGLGRLGGKGALALGAAIGGSLAIGAGFSEALERGALSDRLAAQLGLTEERSAEVGATAGRLYADAYGEGIGEVNGAVAAVMSSIAGMRDASSADLEAMTARALNFASAFEVDVARASQVAGQLITNGLAKDGAAAFDLLTAASQRVPAAVREDVLDAADEYGQFFASLGYSGEQAFALLTDASAQGMYGIDKAGDAIKEFTVRATDMSKASTDAYDAIGLNAERMAAKILEGGPAAQDATQKIIDGLLGIKDPADQANTAIALFGTPLEDLNTAEIPAFLESLRGTSDTLGEVSGASDRMGESLRDNAQTNLTSFARQAQSLAVDFIGGKLLPGIESVASTLADEFGPAVEDVSAFITDTAIPAVRDFAGWIEENQTPITIVAGLIAAVLLPHLIRLGIQQVITTAQVVGGWIAQQVAAVTSSAVSVASTYRMIGAWIAARVAALASFGQTIAIMSLYAAESIAAGARAAGAWVASAARTVASLVMTAAGFVAQGAVMVGSMAVTVASVVAGWAVMGAQALLAAGRVALAWIIAMGPIALVIAAVIGVVTLIVQNWDTILSATQAAWGAVTGAVSAAWEWIKGAVAAALDFLVFLFLNFTGVGLIIQHWDTIKRVTSEAFSAVVGFVTDAFWWVVNAISTGVTDAVSFVASLPGKILGALGDFGSLLFNKGKDLMQGLVDGIGAAGQFVGDTARKIVNAVIGFINTSVISGLNNLLEFEVMGVTVNPPDIPPIPTLHSGGVFDSGNGEGLALLRDQERVATPEQRQIADNLLADLLDGRLALPAGGGGPGVIVEQTITAERGASVEELSAVVARDTVWALETAATRRPELIGAAS